MSEQSENVAAVLEEPKARLKTVVRPIPSPGEGEILVRNHAIAANPVDWKIQDFGIIIDNYPTVLGSDVCGVVMAIGPGVTKFQVGDRVAGFAAVIYNQDPDHGAWQTYTILREVATMRVPRSLSFAEGATFPMAFATASVAFFANLGLPRPSNLANPQGPGFLVWGGSSSIGTAAIQLARNMGFRVFTTASLKHRDYLKSLGASEVVDYQDPQAVVMVIGYASAAGTPIRHGFDAITKGDSSINCCKTLLGSGKKGGKLVLSYNWPTDDPKPEGIEITQTKAFLTGTSEVELGSWLFNDYLPMSIENMAIRPSPKVTIVDGGIEAVQKAFDKLKRGVSGTKLVVKLD
jgi:NADPH:quinone reductase-like Zn-dependent oxidoreductase